MKQSRTILNCPHVVARSSLSKNHLVTDDLGGGVSLKGLSVPHHYTTGRVDFRSPPADKARKNARLFGRRVCLTVIGCRTAGWPRLGICSFSQKSKSVSSFVCVKTLESHFLNAAEWSGLARQITVPGCFSNQ